MGIPLTATSSGDGGDMDGQMVAAFVRRARAVADAGQYEYAIEMYLQAAAITPADVAIHQALRYVSLKRKATGGSDLGSFEKAKLSKRSPDPLQTLLNAEKLLAYDPGNTDRMASALRAAEDAKLDAVAQWLRTVLRRTSE